jgi:hypothetical protein
MAAGLALALGLGLVKTVPADWPRFRGPNGTATDLSVRLPAKLGAENVLWAKEIPSGGSSPVIAGGRVFVTSATSDGSTRHVHGLDPNTGDLLWTAQVKLGEGAGGKIHKKNTHATSTPATNGRMVASLFSTPDLLLAIAHDRDGKELWRRELGGYASEHGSGSSLLLEEGKVIVSNEQDGPSAILALDAATGTTVWTAPRPNDHKKKRACYGTPFLMDVGNKGKALVVSSTAGLTAYAFATGKRIWQADPFEARVVSSPVQAGDHILAISGGGTKGDLLVGYRTGGNGDVTKSHAAWSETKSLPYCTSPLVVGDRFLMACDVGGLLVCRDAKTGASHWMNRIPPRPGKATGNFAASPVRSADSILIVSEEGDLVQIAPDLAAFKILSRGFIDDSFITTPALADGKVYLRGEKKLWCLGPVPKVASINR